MNFKKKYELWFVFGIASFTLMGGIIIGIFIQQMVFTASAVEFGESLEGTTFNIEVDLNETVLVDKFAEVFIPLFNETLQEEKEE
jgi:hypothetical protein